jgi:hypothetical protein
MSAEPQRTRPSCGNEFSGSMEFCPVCMLRKGLGGGIESGESSTADTLELKPVEPAQRFEHYELVMGEPNRMREWSPSHGCLSGRKRPFRTRQFFAFRLAVAIKSQKRLEHDTIRTGETFITAKDAKGVMELVKKGIR